MIGSPNLISESLSRAKMCCCKLRIFSTDDSLPSYDVIKSIYGVRKLLAYIDFMTSLLGNESSEEKIHSFQQHIFALDTDSEIRFGLPIAIFETKRKTDFPIKNL